MSRPEIVTTQRKATIECYLSTDVNGFSDGWVGTPHGIVAIKMVQPVSYPEMSKTWMTFCHKGMIADRSFAAVYTEKRLIALAHRFAREIAGAYEL